MAQRKSPPARKSTGGKSASARSAGSGSNTAGKRTGTSTTGGATSGGRSTATKQAGAGRTPPRKPGKSIVNQKQRPWGLIAATVAVVLFAVAIVIVVIATRKDSTTGAGSTTAGGQAIDKNDPYRQPALPAAMKIKGVTYRVEGEHTHVNGVIKYDASPPIGGNHSPLWANCTGVVYDHQIANENAVHMLEHGAVWITYNPKTLPASQLTALKKYVQGVDRTALSPYAGLSSPISMQAWGYQLFLNSASDPRIAQFIATLKYNPKTTPENASCSDPYFKADQSKPGHPQDSA